jgi:hypothetical protein
VWKLICTPHNMLRICGSRGGDRAVMVPRGASMLSFSAVAPPMPMRAAPGAGGISEARRVNSEVYSRACGRRPG